MQNRYKVDDYPTINREIFTSVLDAVQTKFPIENANYKLELNDIQYDKKLKYNKADQKKAIQQGKSLTVKLRGKWSLTDKLTNKVVSKSNLRTVMNVPYLTERGTFIRNGTEMTVPIQMRLVPSIYTRKAENGEIKAHINVRQGTGNPFSLHMNPKTSVFNFKSGTRTYKALPVLKHMGITDRQMIDMWGQKIYQQNFNDFRKGGWYSKDTLEDTNIKKASETTTVMYSRSVGKTAQLNLKVADIEETINPYQEFIDRIKDAELDPIATEHTVGKPYKKVEADALLQTTGNLIRLSKGERESDNRDSLENQQFYMTPDLLSERVKLDAGNLSKNLMWKLTRHLDTEKIPSGVFNNYMNTLFTEAKLGQAIEEVNPLDAYLRSTRITRMGEGGIGSERAAPMSARLVHNTYKGFIDPTSSPECYVPDTEVFTTNGWARMDEVNNDTEFACFIDGRMEYHKADKINVYDYKGPMYGYESKRINYLVTPTHRMWSSMPGRSKKTGLVFEGKVELVENMHKKQRVFYASKDNPKEGMPVNNKTTLNKDNHYIQEDYKGKVYCPTVPGGLLFVRRNNGWGFICGNSMRVGLDSQVASGVTKGRDGKLYTTMLSALDGKPVQISSLEASKVPISFPEYINSKDKLVPAMIYNKIKYIPKNQVRYFIPSGDSMFGTATNLIPFKNSIKAGRLLMASKHQGQAVSLSARQAPYVQTTNPEDTKSSTEEMLSNIMGAQKAPVAGKVIKVTPDEIVVRDGVGTMHTVDLYNNFPLNRKSFLYNTTNVKIGDIVKKGQVLAGSNYTDKEGVSALGTHLRSALIPWKGENYKDAIIISDKAAEKLTREHL